MLECESQSGFIPEQLEGYDVRSGKAIKCSIKMVVFYLIGLAFKEFLTFEFIIF